MSALSDSAHVAIVAAEFASIQPGSTSVTIVGGPTAIMIPDKIGAVQTAGFSLCVMTSFSPKFVGEVINMVISLENEHGDLYTLPTSVEGPGGTLATLQIAMTERIIVKPPQNVIVPSGVVRPRFTAVLNFSNGLPLKPGLYQWRVTIDTETRDEWTESFYVAGVSPDLAAPSG